MTPLLQRARSVARALGRSLLAVGLIHLPGGTLRAQGEQFSVPPNSILPNYNRVNLGQREALEGGAYVARTDDALAN